MERITDTHAHLSDPLFDADRGEVLERAAQAGVFRIVAVGENIGDARRNLAFAAQWQQVLPAAGFSPMVLDLDAAADMERFIRHERERLAAVGEVGLDHWKVKDERSRELQREIFRRFVRLAVDLELPLNVHSRAAGRQVIALLLESGAERVQLHAFDGRFSTAEPAVEAGYLFSIPPSVVRSRQKQKLVKRLPLSALLVETDSPALAAVPGRRNEPAEAAAALVAMAELKGVSPEEAAEVMAHNADRLYGRDG